MLDCYWKTLEPDEVDYVVIKSNKIVEEVLYLVVVKVVYCNDVDMVVSNATVAVIEDVHIVHPMQRILDCKHIDIIDQMD